jgi:hypothetical protein
MMSRNPGIEGRFRRIDNRHFTAVIYREGKALARCRVWFGGTRSFAGGICYAHNDDATDSSFNESLFVEATDQALFLRPLGMASIFSGRQDAHLTMEGGA